jgi:hypothetical protein
VVAQPVLVSVAGGELGLGQLDGERQLRGAAGVDVPPARVDRVGAFHAGGGRSGAARLGRLVVALRRRRRRPETAAHPQRRPAVRRARPARHARRPQHARQGALGRAPQTQTQNLSKCVENVHPIIVCVQNCILRLEKSHFLYRSIQFMRLGIRKYKGNATRNVFFFNFPRTVSIINWI